MISSGDANGTFTLNSGATLKTGNSTGVNGTVTVTGTKTFNTGANYVFNGSVSQTVGSNLPTPVASLTIANTGAAGNNTVTGAANQTVSGLLGVQQGIYAGTNQTTGSFSSVTIDSGAALTPTGGGAIRVGGNWSNSGTFTANSGTVNLIGAAQTISGATIFNNLAKSTATAQTLTFAAGSSTTVNGSLTLAGASGQLLSLRSGTTGTQWNLSAPTTQAVSFVNVSDSNASGGNTIAPTNSVNSGNNVNWLFTADVVSFKNAPYTDSETNADHTFTVTVQRVGTGTGAVSVNYATSDGTATIANNDYVAASGTLNWANGDTADKTFNITVKGDIFFEANETINLMLSSPSLATVGTPNPTTLTIANDDSGNADHIVFAGVPSTGTANNNLSNFTVEARRPDNTVDTSYTGNVVITKASGSGNLTGTTTKAAVAGVAIFNDLKFDAPDTYTLNADSSAFSRITSGIITISPDPATIQYRSKTSGNWFAIGTWETSTDGINWSNATSVPTDANGAINIRDTHIVTINNALSVDQLTVDTGGQLTLNGSQVIQVQNGTGIDLVINGTFLNQGSAFSMVGTWAVNAGGTYIHNTTTTIDTQLTQAALNAASTFILRGSSSLTPGTSSTTFAGRTFGNLGFESTSSTWSISPALGAGITCATSDFFLGTGVTLNSANLNTTSAFNVSGNLQTDGTITNSSGFANFNLSGASKTISGATVPVFDKLAITATGSYSMTTSVNLPFSSGSVIVNGTLNTGTSAVTGIGGFTLASTGTLGAGSPAGISTTAGTGNIQVTGTRTLNNLGSTFVYNGSVNQAVGNGLPASVSNLTIANTGASGSNTVTGAANQTVTGLLRVQQGIYAGINHTTGFFQGVTIENNATLTVASTGLLNDRGNWDNSGIFIANGGTVSLNGTGAQAISGNTTFNNLSAATATARTLTFAATSTTTVNANLTLTGASGNLLSLRSSNLDVAWNLVAPSTQTVNFVDVRDSNASGGQTVRATNSTNTANNVNWSFTAGTLSFKNAPYTDSETNANHTRTITVQRAGGVNGAVAVSYATSDGTATAGSDYTATSGTLNWIDGDASDKTFTVPITGDTTFETDETINIMLSNPTGGAAIGGTNPTTLTITNDDAQPSISVNDVTFTDAQSAVATGFTVTLSNPSALTVTVHYATSNDTAIAGQDYDAASGTLTFNPGETFKDIPINILDDNQQESTEQFFIDLDTPANATIADGHGIGTIPNDDAANTVNVSLPTNLTALTNTVLTVPVTVSDTTGNNSYSFNISYNQSIISPAAVPYDTAGTISSGSTVTPNTSAPGVLGITANGALNGAGTLIELKFNVVGTPTNCSALSFTSFTFDNANAVIAGPGGMCVRTGNVGGRVTYGTSAMLQAVPGANINAAGLPSLSATTDADGFYNLSGFGTGAYTLTPSKSGGFVAGTFSGFDASLAARHAVGVINLDSNQRIAADASGNGTITSFDASLIAQYAVGITINQPNQTGTWKFVQPNKSYPNIWTDYASEDFAAVLRGDVSGNWTPSGSLADSGEGSLKLNPVRITMADASVTAGDEVVIPINISDVTNRGVYSFDFEIRFDGNVFDIDEDNITALSVTEEEASLQTDFAGILSMPSFVEKTNALSRNYSLAVKRTAKGTLRITGYGIAPLEGAGELLRLKFRAKNGAGVVKSRITWSAAGLNEGVEIPVLAEDAVIGIRQPVE
ncbi:MAG: Calx-beta domain-containing protein [Pyrinomonadaceae bacterium]